METTGRQAGRQKRKQLGGRRATNRPIKHQRGFYATEEHSALAASWSAGVVGVEAPTGGRCVKAAYLLPLNAVESYFVRIKCVTVGMAH